MGLSPGRAGLNRTVTINQPVARFTGGLRAYVGRGAKRLGHGGGSSRAQACLEEVCNQRYPHAGEGGFSELKRRQDDGNGRMALADGLLWKAHGYLANDMSTSSFFAARRRRLAPGQPRLHAGQRVDERPRSIRAPPKRQARRQGVTGLTGNPLPLGVPGTSV
jgi:hypothetical protein